MGKAGDRRWQRRIGLARALRVLIALVPVAASVGGAYVASLRLPSPTSSSGRALWWAGLIAAGLATAWVTDRLMTRFLPLSTLLTLDLAFPDRIPSRFAVALRTQSTASAIRRLESASDGSDVAEQILALATGLGAHDRRARGHSERVRIYADLLGEQLGLGETERERLAWAALIHDIGKLRVSSAALSGSVEPSAPDIAAYGEHPAEGRRLAAALVPWLGSWADAIDQHHERWDGSGFPRGLRGADIGLAARIVAVADAYDTLTSARGTPMTPAQARTEIARGSGTAYDPTVVRALLSISLGRLRGAMGVLAWLAAVPLGGGLRRFTGNAAALVAALLVAANLNPGIIASSTEVGGVSISAPVVAAPATTTVPTTESTTATTPPTTVAATTTITTATTVPPTTAPPTTNVPTSTTTTTAPTTTTPTTTKPVVGSPPRAADDHVRLAEDSVASVDLLANDVDPNGHAPTLVAQPAHVKIELAAGIATITPPPDWYGTDSARYRLCNDTGCSQAGILITVDPVNDPPVVTGNIALSGYEDQTVSAIPKVSDVDGDVLSCTRAAPPAVGTASVAADCSLVAFTGPANWHGTTSFTISVSDGLASTTATVAVTLAAVNDPPVAQGDAATVAVGDSVLIPVLANDSDVDGDPLTLTAVTSPSAGTAVIEGSSVRYHANTVGTQHFDYTVCDPSEACATAAVTVTVLPVFSAVDDLVTVGATGVAVIDVTANDVTGQYPIDPTSVTVVTRPTSGTAVVLASGDILYWSFLRADDSFVYRVCDTAGTCDTATVTIVFRPGSATTG